MKKPIILGEEVNNTSYRQKNKETKDFEFIEEYIQFEIALDAKSLAKGNNGVFDLVMVIETLQEKYPEITENDALTIYEQKTFFKIMIC